MEKEYEGKSEIKDNQGCLERAPNKIISEFYTLGCIRDHEGKLIDDFVGSAIPYDQGMALYNWIHDVRPINTLEIGMGYGLSTLFICQAHFDSGNGGHHIAIDPEQDSIFRSIGLLNIRRANLSNQLHFIEAPSYEILPQLLGQNIRFDLVFIDGMHTFDYALVDFFMLTYY